MSPEPGRHPHGPADVVIAGYGPAGAAAAIAAHDAGASVLVVASAATGGGNARYSGGFLFDIPGPAAVAHLDALCFGRTPRPVLDAYAAGLHGGLTDAVVFGRIAGAGAAHRAAALAPSASTAPSAAAPPASTPSATAPSATAPPARTPPASLGQDGIAVTCVAPGLTDTPAARAGQPAAAFDGVRSRQALPRTLVPQDVASTVAFLATDAAAALTGQTLCVDGGLILR